MKKNFLNNYVKKNRWKRAVVVFLFALLCMSMTLTLTYVNKKRDFLSNQRIQQELEVLIRNELEATDQIMMDYMKEGSHNANHYFMFFSKAEDKAIVSQLEKQTKETVRKLAHTPAAILSYISEEVINEQLIHRNFTIKEYHWQPEEKIFSLEKEEHILMDHLSAHSKEALVLKDLVKNKTNLRAITRVMQEAILNDHDSPKTIIKDVLSLPDLTFDSEVMVLPNSLKISIDVEKFGTDSIEIAYTNISPYIDPDFLMPIGTNSQEQKNKEIGKKIALTFDDGPNTTSTVQLLEILEKEQVDATFFLLGQMVTANPQIAESIVQKGHEVANHSYTHPDLTTLSGDEVKNEVDKADEAIFLATGVLPKTFRPPYGAVNQEVIKKIGLPIIQWEVDSLDWMSRDPSVISKKVIEETHEGSIILLHDIHDSSVKAVPIIIQSLQQKGYTFVTVSDLLADEQKPYYQYFSAENFLSNE